MCDQCSGYESGEPILDLPDKIRLRALEKECYGALGCAVLNEIMTHAVFDDGVVYTGGWAKQRVLMGHDNAAEIAGINKYGICNDVCKFAGVALSVRGIQKDEMSVEDLSE